MLAKHNVLVAQDLSCYGQVALGVALPLLGAAGVSPTALPVAVLSTHTGGFGTNSFCDLSAQIPAICAHWASQNIVFDAAYLGYLGPQAIAQINSPIFLNRLSDDCLLLVDPVMGDHGKLYRGFDADYVAAMRRLVLHACVVTPNLTEASLLLGHRLTTSPVSFTEASRLASQIATQFNVAHVIISGVPLSSGKIGVVGFSQTDAKPWVRTVKKLRGDFFGTGDVFASVVMAGLLHHMTLEEAINLAVGVIKIAIVHTPVIQDPRIGVNYAAGISWMLERLQQG